ncbi:uncharacterized protein LOC131209029 [Anopheles bellator]|uniref:uncharacterized protein LOC131209029 n=1 Tax=Anopheles bellator TaxID=139047 RepID=UPI002649DC90|nr:uncharacterized protein LOC131209029 [Anopheles bellator]
MVIAKVGLLPVVILVVLALPYALGCQGKCDRYEYCDTHGNKCLHCEQLCAKDDYGCFHNCSDYKLKVLEREVSSLQKTIVAFQIMLLVAVAVLVFLALVWLGYKRKHKLVECLRWRPHEKAQPGSAGPVAYTHENPNTKSPRLGPKSGGQGQVKQQPTSTTVSIYPDTEADHSVQTGTTSISHRHPAEDSTESYSYDNAGLNVTPTSVLPKPPKY